MDFNSFFFAELSQSLLDLYFLPHDIHRLEAYSKNQVEYRLILDLTTDLCQLYYQGRLNDVPIDALQKAILLGVGLQNKSIDTLAAEFNMPVNQLLAKFYDCMKKLTRKLTAVMETTVEETMVQRKDLNMGESMIATKQSFADELDEAAKVSVVSAARCVYFVVFIFIFFRRNWKRNSDKS